jgi:hypothetical protein
MPSAHTPRFKWQQSMWQLTSGRRSSLQAACGTDITVDQPLLVGHLSARPKANCLQPTCHSHLRRHRSPGLQTGPHAVQLYLVLPGPPQVSILLAAPCMRSKAQARCAKACSTAHQLATVLSGLRQVAGVGCVSSRTPGAVATDCLAADFFAMVLQGQVQVQPQATCLCVCCGNRYHHPACAAPPSASLSVEVHQANSMCPARMHTSIHPTRTPYSHIVCS